MAFGVGIVQVQGIQNTGFGHCQHDVSSKSNVDDASNAFHAFIFKASGQGGPSGTDEEEETKKRKQNWTIKRNPAVSWLPSLVGTL